MYRFLKNASIICISMLIVISISLSIFKNQLITNSINGELITFTENNVHYVQVKGNQPKELRCSVWYLIKTSIAIRNILYIASAFGVIYLLKCLILPYLVKKLALLFSYVFKQMSLFFANGRLEKFLFKFSLIYCSLSLVFIIGTIVFANELLGISNIAHDNGHYIEEGLCYIADGNGELHNVARTAYYMYFYFLRPGYYILFYPFVILFFYLMFRHWIPFTFRHMWNS